jgi:hypothetical protein
MSVKSCFECGGTVSTAARSCPHCGAPVASRRYYVRTWLGALALLVAGSTAGYLLGPGPAGKVARAREALGDATYPVSQVLTDRQREELVRYELERYVRVQDRFFLEHGRYQNYSEAPIEEGDFRMNYVDDAYGKFWMASLHFKGRPSVYCAVAVGRPGYLQGIVLKESGGVRCSRDLATRINRVLLQVIPVRFLGVR